MTCMASSHHATPVRAQYAAPAGGRPRPDSSRRASRAEAAAVSRVFASLHKRALGIAVGTVAALVVGGVTLASLVVDPEGRFPLELLAVYFYGYSLTPLGALIGAAWAFVGGFFLGWFAAFVRNFVLLMWLVVARARLRYLETQDLLDHL